MKPFRRGELDRRNKQINKQIKYFFKSTLVNNKDLLKIVNRIKTVFYFKNKIALFSQILKNYKDIFRNCFVSKITQKKTFNNTKNKHFHVNVFC